MPVEDCKILLEMTAFSGRFSNRYQNSAEDMDIWGGGGGFGGGGDRIDTWGGPGGAGGYFDQGNGQQGRNKFQPQDKCTIA